MDVVFELLERLPPLSQLTISLVPNVLTTNMTSGVLERLAKLETLVIVADSKHLHLLPGLLRRCPSIEIIGLYLGGSPDGLKQVQTTSVPNLSHVTIESLPDSTTSLQVLQQLFDHYTIFNLDGLDLVEVDSLFSTAGSSDALLWYSVTLLGLKGATHIPFQLEQFGLFRNLDILNLIELDQVFDLNKVLLELPPLIESVRFKCWLQAWLPGRLDALAGPAQLAGKRLKFVLLKLVPLPNYRELALTDAAKLSLGLIKKYAQMGINMTVASPAAVAFLN